MRILSVQSAAIIQTIQGTDAALPVNNLISAGLADKANQRNTIRNRIGKWHKYDG